MYICFSITYPCFFVKISKKAEHYKSSSIILLYISFGNVDHFADRLCCQG